MKLYNTMKRQKEEFVPIEDGKVKMYVCGPTVYDYIHIGNARPYVVFDTLRRYLEFRGYDVNYVQNFTDIDDKIIRKANEEGVTFDIIADRYIKEALKDAEGLNVKKPTVAPRVTEEIDGIISMISYLIEKGYAYEKNGSVYFDTENDEDYGKLSKRDLDQLESGVRIDVDEEKKSPMDFILWKPKKEGEPYWDSPWSKGRPGWHIECSVMAKKYLGDTLDIHAGGEDLIFPHHENEIAQSEAANGKDFVRYWLHNGFIKVDNKKMSKSEGNFFTLREISEQFPYDVVRFYLLSSHYRSPINFSRELMLSAESSLGRIKTCLSNLKFAFENARNKELTEEENTLLKECEEFKKSFIESMDDDLNTADAIASIFDFVRFANTNINENSSAEFSQKIYEKIKELCDILGIETEVKSEEVDTEKIEQLIAERSEAKKAKDFARADAIRNELLDMGIVIEDTRQGVRWYKES
ncbi:MAG: cysteine--tRNA ligase [Lachnospiraceae bacterium]|nr:cysteine--tRNA ligase [Lachnospiraceae bacterium]